jgi:hypothetical protein
VIIHNLNIFRACVRPTETKAELIVYANAVLPYTITLQEFQSIARRYAQIAQPSRNLQLPQFAPRYRGNVVESSDRLSL